MNCTVICIELPSKRIYVKLVDVDGKAISDVYSEAIKAEAVYNSGPAIIRNEIPLNKVISFTRGGGSYATTGGNYSSIEF